MRETTISSCMPYGTAATWVRAGLTALALSEAVVGVWGLLSPRVLRGLPAARTSLGGDASAESVCGRAAWVGSVPRS